jgi:hypothetical protein
MPSAAPSPRSPSVSSAVPGPAGSTTTGRARPRSLASPSSRTIPPRQLSKDFSSSKLMTVLEEVLEQCPTLMDKLRPFYKNMYHSVNFHHPKDSTCKNMPCALVLLCTALSSLIPAAIIRMVLHNSSGPQTAIPISPSAWSASSQRNG